jgi:pseudouridine synthase
VRESLRLNRYLATAGVASRRRCDELIRQGRVRVNGAPVEELGVQVDPARDTVVLDGDAVRLPDRRWILALHKPCEVLVAASDARGRRTVMDLMRGFPGRVFPVGRLDYRSEGLLLLTNDGELAHRLAHPRFKVAKLYRVDARGAVAPATVESLARGVTLDDGPTQPARVRIVSRGDGQTRLDIELREGRKRQVRRMLALFGHDVVRLVRIRFGPVELGDLPSGRWRELGGDEAARLRRAVGLPPAAGGGRAA